jgi:uncharacterized protein
MAVVATIPKITVAEALALELEEREPFETTSSEPLPNRGRTLWTSGDGTVEVGVWECDPKPFHADFPYGEFVRVIRGSLICRGDDGSEFTLETGDAMVFPRGWTGLWDVQPGFHKIFALWHHD